MKENGIRNPNMTEDSLTLNKAGNIFNYNQKSAGLVKNILSHDQEHEWTNILAGGRHYVSGALSDSVSWLGKKNYCNLNFKFE